MIMAMRQGSLFAALRGKDGRSLAWALIALVLISVFVGGLNSGVAATGDTALCLVDDAGGKAPPPAHHHQPECCILGSSPLGAGLAAAPLAAGPPFLSAGTDLVWAEAGAAAPGAWTGGATARGPPLEA
jgi:hypothetical protein